MSHLSHFRLPIILSNLRRTWGQLRDNYGTNGTKKQVKKGKIKHYETKEKKNRLLLIRCFYVNLLARPRRFERPTTAFGGRYSIQLSYGRFKDKSTILTQQQTKRLNHVPSLC